MKLDKKLIRIMGIAAGSLIILIIIIALIASCTANKKYNYNDFEAKMITLAKEYYSQNSSLLPAENHSTSLTIAAFLSEEKINSLELKTGETCHGEITVKNNNGHYLYLPNITCGEHVNKKLTTEIMEKNSTVTSGNGLYLENGNYIFRGENVNNYLSFADKIWMILRIKDDGSLRIIETTKRKTSVTWDDRYNIVKKTNTGLNDLISNNVNSRIQDTLLEIYKSDEFTSEQKAYFLKQDLCIGKRSVSDSINDGSIECSAVYQDQIFGLIQVNEFLQASLDPNCVKTDDSACVNYNYLTKLNGNTWTITADSETNYKVFKISDSVFISNANSSSSLKITASLSGDVILKSGSGTEADPYIIK